MKELDLIGAKYHLLDLSEFPQSMNVGLHYKNGDSNNFILDRADGQSIDLRDFRVGWWRRPQPFTMHTDIKKSTYLQFAYNECFEAFSGLWPALNIFWINPPNLNQVGSYKVYQLKVAQDSELKIPQTLVSNSYQKALEFIQRHGPEKTICKAFSATEKDWRETRLIQSKELQNLHNLQYAPVIFQEYIEAFVDLRITIIGDQIFPAAIYSQESSYKVDMRMDWKNTRTEAFEIPNGVKEKLLLFMKKMGLVYGAVDMRLKPDGEYIFLEVNPAGQWLFVEERTGQAITSAFAKFMYDKAICGGRNLNSV